MDRLDLHSTFTKIVLWKLLQFRRIVYLDADMVALRAPDELFDLVEPFSAAPDIGWPDIFNTGMYSRKVCYYGRGSNSLRRADGFNSKYGRLLCFACYGTTWDLL